jgi:hypothetical protein
MKNQTPKNYVFWLLLVIAVSILIVYAVIYLRVYSPSPVPSSEADYNTLSLDAEGIMLKYPKNWIASLATEPEIRGKIIALIRYPGSASPKVLIYKTDFEVSSLVEVESWGSEIAAKNIPFKEVSRENVELDNFSAIVFEYSRTFNTFFGATTNTCKDLYFTNHLFGYIFSFCADDSHWAGFSEVYDLMVHSIETE